jgi:hypothetical protein
MSERDDECRTTLGTLEFLSGGEVSPVAARALRTARRDLSRCPECAQAFDDGERVRVALARAVRRTVVPPSLRLAIRAGLRRERGPADPE